MVIGASHPSSDERRQLWRYQHPLWAILFQGKQTEREREHQSQVSIRIQ